MRGLWLAALRLLAAGTQGSQNDLRFAARQALRRPVFSLTAIALLALGLGSATAIFSLLYPAVVAPLPYPHPEQLVSLHNRFPSLHLDRLGVSSLDYLDLRQHHELFSDAGAFHWLDLTRSGIRVPVKVNAVAMTTSLFRTLQVQPVLGRLFTPQEELYHGPRAVLLSECYWRSQFASDPQILRKTLRLNGELYPIIGVLPANFIVPNNVTEMWTPLTFSPKQLAPAARQNHYLHFYARLAFGLDLNRASALLDRLSRRMSLDHPDDYPIDRLGWRFFLAPLAQDDDGSDRFWLITLFIASACLLLIIAANLAGLFTVRSTERQFDLAVCRTLGASPFRIARSVAAEILLISFAGGLLGLFTARALTRLLSHWSPFVPSKALLQLPVFTFGASLTLLTGLLCSLYPAWSASRIHPHSPLKEGGHQRTSSGSQRRLRSALILAQVALATALLLSGGLLVRSLLHLLETPLGFDPRNVLTAQISLPRPRYSSPELQLSFYNSVLASVRRLPGVQAASTCSLLPFGYGETINTFTIAGRPAPRVGPIANLNNVLPDFFSTLEIPLLQGQTFSWTARLDSEPVAIIDRTLAARYFPGQNTIGQALSFPWQSGFKIIGVVGALKTSSLEDAASPTVYFNALAVPLSDASLVLRSSLPAQQLASAVQKIVAQVDPDQPIYDVASLQSRVDASVKTRRFVVALVLACAASGLVLASLSLYGLLSYSILLRRREFGIRIAIGARPSHIRSLILRSGLVSVSLGIVAGSAAALALGRLFASYLYATSVWDSAAWSTVASILVFACSAACALPAWRAGRLHPLDGLRDR